MWNRTKRLINSYLDNMIDRVERPDSDVREVTRGELSRLNELEVGHRANAKVLEKQIAEIDLKITAIAERDKILQRRGEVGQPDATASQLSALGEQRAMLVKQLADANSAAERAKTLRSERVAEGNELANQTHVTSMQENLADIQSSFGVNNPSAVIDEMRARIARKGTAPGEAQTAAADADRELANELKRTKVDDMLSQYKRSLSGELDPGSVNPPQSAGLPNQDRSTAPPNQPAAGRASDLSSSQDELDSGQAKTLGRADGPIRPID